MPFSLISNIGAGGTSGSCTTGSFDTTGASLIVVAVATGNSGASHKNNQLTDSKGNVWFLVSPFESTFRCSIWISYPDSVGSGHTITYSASSSFPSVFAAAFACTNPRLDKWSAAGSTSPGSVTPTGDNELFVCGMGNIDTSTTPTVGSSFTRTDYQLYVAGTHLGGAMAYKIQTTGGAENPAWNIGTETNMVVFREISGGGGGGGLIGGGSLSGGFQ